jgi:Domain of unknown function (DUF202)
VNRVSPAEDVDATRRTYLASERTELAWWRTGLYGVAAIAYGSRRRGVVERALAEGRYPDPPRFAHAALAGAGVALGLLTVALILAN